MPELTKEAEIVLAGRAGYEAKFIYPRRKKLKVVLYPSFREVTEFNQAIGVQLPQKAKFLCVHPFVERTPDGKKSVALWFASEKDAVEEVRYFIVSENDTVVDPTPYSLQHLGSAFLSDDLIYHVWERLV